MPKLGEITDNITDMYLHANAWAQSEPETLEGKITTGLMTALRDQLAARLKAEHALDAMDPFHIEVNCFGCQFSHNSEKWREQADKILRGEK